MFGKLASPFLLRRGLVELRRTADALERIAAVLELQAQAAPRSGQTFRGFSHAKDPDTDGSGVSYADPKEMERSFVVERELITLLGRSPTPEELERGMLGDIE